MSGKFARVSRGRMFQRKALALAIGGSIALGFSAGAFAQATTGTIYGTVPVAAGETIQITGGAGINRTITVGPSGRYSVTLPVGTYTVSLLQNGQVVQTKTNVTPAAAGAVAVDFTSSAAANVQTLSAINVTATAIPEIDVSTTNQVTTITAKQLEALPLQRSAENIALLAPGVSPGAPLLGSGPTGGALLVFGGASVAENAYYLDGMNTTDQITGQGGVSLPYGAIEEQQTFTSGYGAKYGRSIGGVINQIGKSGSNEWHFGFKALWEPNAWRSDTKNNYYTNPLYVPGNPAVTVPINPNQVPGQLRVYGKADSQQESVYDAYVGGPIIKDKLFFFAAVEQDNTSGTTITNNTTSLNEQWHQHQPKIYAKINWNINDSNILTLTGVQNQYKYWQGNYNFDYGTLKTGDFNSLGQTTKNSFRIWVANYTSYLTDNLTMHAMFGKMHGEYFVQQPAYPGFSPLAPHIGSASYQNPAFLPPSGPIRNLQQHLNIAPQGHRDTVMNYRVDLDWKLPWNILGTHDIQFGIDNITTWDIGDGSLVTGPGYGWYYGVADPSSPILGVRPTLPPYVGPPNSVPNGEDGYVVSKLIFQNFGSVRVAQRAQYIEDRWQIAPNFLLDLGIRNDQFTNYNPAGQPYIRLTKPQWAPRIGFSWDVHGDSTMKVFGNAGRYYLALPAGVAMRGAGASLYTNEYYTYSGITQSGDFAGVPTGLTPLPQNNGGHPGGVSANNEYGQPLDPRTVASQNIKAEYSDNFTLGMQQQFHMLGSTYVFGVDGLLQKMGPDIVDDWDDQTSICQAALAQGVAYPGATTDDQITSCRNVTNGAVLINPTQTSDLLITGGDGQLHKVVISPADQLFDRPVKRKYYALNLSLTHPFDGKWFGKIVYTWSREYGNTEGPVDSIIGQGGHSVSITEQWDYWQLMQWSYGPLPNNHTNQLKAYGYFQVNPDWRVGGNLFIQSGRPWDCLGHFGTDQSDPLGYGNAYHWCAGMPAPPGSTGNTPWIHELSLNVNYSPSWADHKLNFNLAVLNALNQQTPTQYYYSYGKTSAPDPTYGLVEGRTPPRQWVFYVSYDW